MKTSIPTIIMCVFVVFASAILSIVNHANHESVPDFSGKRRGSLAQIPKLMSAISVNRDLSGAAAEPTYIVVMNGDNLSGTPLV